MTNERIRAVLYEELGNLAPEADASAVDPDANLREALDLDSMDFLNLIIALHERLGIEIPATDYAELLTLNKAIGYLSGKLAA
jgi:acyl carrier protein